MWNSSRLWLRPRLRLILLPLNIEAVTLCKYYRFQKFTLLPTNIRKLPQRQLCPSESHRQHFWESPLRVAVTSLAHYPLTSQLCVLLAPVSPLQQVTGAGTGGSTAGSFCAILWPPPSTLSKQELAQAWPGLRHRVPRAPSTAGLRLPAETQRGRAAAGRAQHTQLGSTGAKRKMKTKSGDKMRNSDNSQGKGGRGRERKFKRGKLRKIFTGSTDGSSSLWASTCLQGLAEHSEAPNASIISMTGTSVKIKSFSSWKLMLCPET